MLCLSEHLGTALRVSYPGRRISIFHLDVDELYFSGLEISGKKQVVVNSMHRKDYMDSLFTFTMFQSVLSNECNATRTILL